MDVKIISSIILGLGLSAAVGFRIFVPALITAVAGYYDAIELIESMQWMTSMPAIITLSVATIAEILAFYIPFVDNLLDTVATPAAAICGTLLMGSTIVEMEPLIKWPISIIAGGGLATAVQSGTSVVRATSSGLTAGMGNPFVSTLEAILATIMSFLSILLPVAAGAVILYITYRFIIKKRLKPKAS